MTCGVQSPPGSFPRSGVGTYPRTLQRPPIECPHHRHGSFPGSRVVCRWSGIVPFPRWSVGTIRRSASSAWIVPRGEGCLPLERHCSVPTLERGNDSLLFNLWIVPTLRRGNIPPDAPASTHRMSASSTWIAPRVAGCLPLERHCSVLIVATLRRCTEAWTLLRPLGERWSVLRGVTTLERCNDQRSKPIPRTPCLSNYP
jgi:hypothetical protein